jgi:hypothetical protein
MASVLDVLRSGGTSAALRVAVVISLPALAGLSCSSDRCTCPQDQPGPVQWPISQGGNGHYYEAVLDTIDWVDARTEAERSGGYLATITSAAENQFVYSLVTHPAFWIDDGYHGPLLGGFQSPGSPEPGGEWAWVTGEPWGYANWWPGQPDNAGGAEHCLQFHGGPIYGGALWNDIRELRSEGGYIVEYDEDPCRMSGSR